MAPVLAELGPVTLYTHDVFSVLGLLAGLALYYRALGRDRILDPRIVLISVSALLGGALGARLITSWEVADEVTRGRAARLLPPDAWTSEHHRRAGQRVPGDRAQQAGARPAGQAGGAGMSTHTDLVGATPHAGAVPGALDVPDPVRAWLAARPPLTRAQK